MDVKIPYLFIFGILSITTGKPAAYYQEASPYVRNEYELQNLLQSLAEQGVIEISSNNREDAPNDYYENRAGSSRYSVNPSQLYYKAPQHYESDENADYEQPRNKNYQMINNFLKRNDATQASDNVQNVLEDLLSQNRDNEYSRNNNLYYNTNDEADVDEVVALLKDLQRVSDVANYRDNNDYGMVSRDKIRGNLLREDDDDKPAKPVKSAVLSLAKNGVKKLFANLVRISPEFQNLILPYLNLGNSENSKDVRDDVDDTLRCSGKNCARNNVNDDQISRLRCRGRYCARSTNDDDVTNLKYDPKLQAQKIKVNDELDAVVLGLSDVDRLLTKLAPTKSQRTNKPRESKILQNVDFENLFTGGSGIDKKENVEAIVFDLTKVENGDAVAKQIKRLLTRNNKESYDEYADYGNLVEDHLKQGIYDLQKQTSKGRANSKYSPYKQNNNNKLYIPQWLLDEVAARSHRRKSLLPLTRQQKERRNKNRQQQKSPRGLRRNFDQVGDDVGVPFHMEIQGLGQVNP